MGTSSVSWWDQYVDGEKFRMCHQSLKKDDLQGRLETYLRKNRSEINEIKLRNCHVNPRTVKMLSRLLKKEMIKVDLSANFNLPPRHIAKLFENTSPKRVILSECVISPNDELMKVLFDSTIMYLDLSHQGFSAKDTARCLKRFAESSELKKLRMADCGVTSNDLQTVAEEINGEGIHLKEKSIDLSCNDIGLEGMKSLGKILSYDPPSQIKSLQLCDCDLDVDKLEAFRRHTNAEITKLDLSDNPIGEDEDKSIKTLVKLIGQVKCKDFAMRNCDIESATSFLESNGSDELTLRRLDFSENFYIDAKVVGQLTKKWKVEELILRNCLHEAEDLKGLIEGLDKHKLKLLDIRETAETASEMKQQRVQGLRLVHDKVYF